MLSIKRYVKAESLEAAYELNQKRANRIIAGMLWMKLGDKTINTAIDLSNVVSHTIEEQKDAFIIGAMTSLRDLEINEGLNGCTNGALKESLRHIVGVQFRNTATVGGSIFGRFGFSDVLTMFLALDTYVELYKGGVIPLETFVKMPYDNDILMNIIVKKVPLKTAYCSFRNTNTDFPVLTCAVSVMEGHQKAVIGARPEKAMVIEVKGMEISPDNPEEFAKALAEHVAERVKVSGNMRASAKYRQHLVKVLTKRACLIALERGEAGLC